MLSERVTVEVCQKDAGHLPMGRLMVHGHLDSSDHEQMTLVVTPLQLLQREVRFLGVSMIKVLQNGSMDGALHGNVARVITMMLTLSYCITLFYTEMS